MNYCQSFCRTIQRLCNSGGDGIVLPDAYQRVSYLQSSGTQYINIGAAVNHQYYDVDFEWVSFVDNSVGTNYNANTLLGYNDYTSQGTPDTKIILRRTNVISPYYRNTNIGNAPLSYGVKCNIYLTNSSFSVSGLDYTDNTTTAQTGTVDVYVFTAHNRSEASSRLTSAVKLYRLKTSSVELYPCYRKSDNKPGMYDIVNNGFYVNQGTGEFTVGNNV